MNNSHSSKNIWFGRVSDKEHAKMILKHVGYASLFFAGLQLFNVLYLFVSSAEKIGALGSQFIFLAVLYVFFSIVFYYLGRELYQVRQTKTLAGLMLVASLMYLMLVIWRMYVTQVVGLPLFAILMTYIAFRGVVATRLLVF